MSAEDPVRRIIGVKGNGGVPHGKHKPQNATATITTGANEVSVVEESADKCNNQQSTLFSRSPFSLSPLSPFTPWWVAHAATLARHFGWQRGKNESISSNQFLSS
jgi:hypothetical protein